LASGARLSSACSSGLFYSLKAINRSLIVFPENWPGRLPWGRAGVGYDDRPRKRKKTFDFLWGLVLNSILSNGLSAGRPRARLNIGRR
jgi:hypothetical protein